MKTHRRTIRAPLLGAILAAASGAHAHPVFFADGWGLTFWNAPHKTEAYGAYTLSHRFALGARYFGFRDLEGEGMHKLPGENHYIAQASWLVKRWNAMASQGNIYLQAGAGAARLARGKTRPSFMAEVEGDWEDRRLYTVAKLKYLKAEGEHERAGALARFGFAPYLADFNELNTWIIVEAEKAFRGRDSLDVTPFVRLFYNNFLTELGHGLDGGFRFNFMTHF